MNEYVHLFFKPQNTVLCQLLDQMLIKHNFEDYTILHKNDLTIS